ncbi:MAG: LSU ribosomal protein L30p (L7e), partial [uncultured Propionibacteriaceae bacterium]
VAPEGKPDQVRHRRQAEPAGHAADARPEAGRRCVGQRGPSRSSRDARHGAASDHRRGGRL